MRILQVVHNFQPYGLYGGVEVSTYNLCKALPESCKVLVFCRGGTYVKNRLAETKETYQGISVIRIFFQDDIKSQNPTGADLAKRAFKKVIAEVRPDVIHFQHLLGFSPDFVSIARELGIATVLHLHDYWYLCPNVMLMYANSEPCEGPGDLSRCVLCGRAGGFAKPRNSLIISDLIKILAAGPIAYKIATNRPLAALKRLRKAKSILEVRGDRIKPTMDLESLRVRHQKLRETLGHVDVIIANSDFVRRKYIEWGLPPSKIELLYFGHDFSNIKLQEKKRREHLRFGYLGNLTFSKGVDILVKAFSQLKEGGGTLLSLYGDSEPEFAGYLRAIAGGSNVQFMGAYSVSQLSDIFTNIDVLFVPSIWPEAYGLVISEAFMAKIPVVAARVGGIPEQVVHDVNGLLFEPGDTDQLRAHMERIIKERDLLERLSQGINPPKTIQEYAREVRAIYSFVHNKQKRINPVCS